MHMHVYLVEIYLKLHLKFKSRFMETNMPKQYAKAYEELCRRSGCTKNERIAIEQDTFNIIKCSYDNLYTGFVCHAGDLNCVSCCCLNSIVQSLSGFENSKKSNIMKMIVNCLIDNGKTSDVVMIDVDRDDNSKKINSIKSIRTILKKNENLESLLISNDLNCSNDNI